METRPAPAAPPRPLYVPVSPHGNPNPGCAAWTEERAWRQLAHDHGATPSMVALTALRIAGWRVVLYRPA